MEPLKGLRMSEKWKKRKMLLNRRRMVQNMSDIQEVMLEISDHVYHNKDYFPTHIDSDKLTDFKEYSKNLLNNIKNGS